MIKMPYKHEYTKTKIKKEDDKRIKLTDQERKEIKKLYNVLSQRQLAKMFNVSRRLIQFIGNPEKYKHNLELRKNRIDLLGQIYYKKYKHTKQMQKHRRYKQELYKKGRLIK